MEGLKVVFLGAELSGKTALLIRALFDEFESDYAPTLEDNYRHSFIIGFKEHMVDIIDTGGMDVYRSEYDRWFSWGDAFVFVYNMTKEDTFFRLKSFRDELQRVKRNQSILLKQIPMILIGTHLDIQQREISEDIGKKMGLALGCPFFETSSKMDTKALMNHSLSTSVLLPSQIISVLIEERAKKFSWKFLDNLCLPEKSLESSRSKKPKSVATKAERSELVSSAIPKGNDVISLLEELREKWKKPIDKLPVYIDLPRLVNKISVQICAKGNAVPLYMQHASARDDNAGTPLYDTSIDRSNPLSGDIVKARSLSNSKSSKSLDASLSIPKRERSLTTKKSPKKDKKSKAENKTKDKEEKKSKEKKFSSSKKTDKQEETSIEKEKILCVGMRVNILTQPSWGKGTIQFKGPIKSGDLMIGIELDNTLITGGSNGSLKGVSYFTCIEHKGVFVKPTEVEPIFIKQSLSLFSGGWIHSDAGEEWIYDSSGILTAKELVNGKHLIYVWDGEYLKPKSLSMNGGGETSLSNRENNVNGAEIDIENLIGFGAGQWNGEAVIWYKKEWMIFRTSKREEFLRFSWDPSFGLYSIVLGNEKQSNLASNQTSAKSGSPSNEKKKELPHWRWYSNGLLPYNGPLPPSEDTEDSYSRSSHDHSLNLNRGWRIEGFDKIPKPIVIFLQMIKYSRFGLEDHSNMIPNLNVKQAEQKNPEKSTEPPQQTTKMEIKEIPKPINNGEIKNVTKTSSDEKLLKLNLQLNNWKFRIPISERADIGHLMLEISRRASKKLSSVAENLLESINLLENQLDQLYEAVLAGNENNAGDAAIVTKQIVATINEQIEDCAATAPTQANDVEMSLLQACNDMEEIQKKLVKSAIVALRDSGNYQAKLDLLQVINTTKKLSMKLSIFCRDVKVIHLKTVDGAELDREDMVSSVLDNESSIIAIVEKKEEDEKLKESELRRKLQHDIEENEKRKNEIAQLEKEEAEQEIKWKELLLSLEGEQTNIRLVKASSKEDLSKLKLLSTEKQDVDHGSKKTMIADLMRDLLCELSDKLEEFEQTKTIKNEFFSFVQQSGGGDTSRQLSKFLQQVLKEDSKLCKVLKAVNQSIIATPFIRLKLAFPNQIPFEDIPGTWKVIVKIVPKEEVVVIHQKSGASRNPSPQGGFEFAWELVMRFPWDLKGLINAQLAITNVTFDGNIIQQNRNQVQQIVNQFSCV